MLSESALREANVFDPQAVVQLLRKCRARGSERAVLEHRQHGAGGRAVDPAPAPSIHCGPPRGEPMPSRFLADIDKSSKPR